MRGARLMRFLTEARRFLRRLPTTLRHVLCGVAVMAALLAPAKPAQAFCVCCCIPAVNAAFDAIQGEIIAQHIETILHIIAQFAYQRLWMVEVYYLKYWGPALAMATEQMSAVAMHQMLIAGAFIDAKHQMETQRLFSQLAAEAHKDYHPSEALCTIGSAARSLGKADMNTEVAALTITQAAMDRQLLNGASNAARGPKEDLEGRVAQFKRAYCDPNDNNRALNGTCTAGGNAARRDKDVDFGRTMWQPWSIDVDFSDTVRTDDEEDILALASNLYNHETFKVVSLELLKDNVKNIEHYLDLRSIAAKRSVALNSFSAIAAMKARGTTDAAQTATYLREIMRELGIANDADIDSIMGAHPSYYAQMEIFTKKMMQNPQFFVNLYDKPANVARIGVALEAFNLMQENDIFNSALRSEQMMSILLELRLSSGDGSEKEYNQNKMRRVLK